jgi:hypothetical protein
MTVMPTPNLLVLFADQQRADTLGCYGQALPVTPHLDRWAAAGTRFAHAFTCQPVCGPARAVPADRPSARSTLCVTDPAAAIDDPTSPTATWVVSHLYDNHADPHQLRDLAADPALAGVRAGLLAELARAMIASGDPAPVFR